MKRFIWSSLVVLLAALPAAAQDRTGTVEISPFGGGNFGGRLYAGSNSVFSQTVDVEASGTYGIRLGVNANRWLGIEAAFSTAKGDIEGRGSSGLFTSGQKLGELDVKQYELNALFNFGRKRVIPYFTLGAGATTFKVRATNVNVSDDTRFSANMGIGLKVFFNPHFAIRFDGRARAAYVNDSDRRCHDDRYCDDYYYDREDEKNWYTNGEVTGGLTIAF